MRDDRERVLDIQEAISNIRKYAQRGRKEFEREELIQIIEKVNQLESLTDKKYREMKCEMAYNSPEIPAGILIIMDHAIRDFESSCDLIEDCADILRSIVLI